MRALIISADRFEDIELTEPLDQLRAKGVVVDDNLISSRQLADIPAFMQAIFQVIGLV